MNRFLSIIFLVCALLSGQADSQLPVYKKKPSRLPKLESQLEDLVDALSVGAARKLATSYALFFEDGKLTVIIERKPDVQMETLRSNISGARLNVEIVRGSKDYLMVRTDIKGLTKLNGIEGVQFIRRPIKPAINIATTEGRDLIGTALLTTSATAGLGVDVAVIDGGFSKLTAAQVVGELPQGQRVDLTGSGFERGSVHGTACAEIIHDLAPAATLHYILVENNLDFQNALKYVSNQGIDIVSQSLSMFGTSAGDGSGPINDMVNQTVNDGTFWINSAGNKATQQWSGDFRDTDGDGNHEFIPGVEALKIHPRGDKPLDLFLTWAEWDRTSNDYDLILLKKENGQWVEVLKAESENINTAPLERIMHQYVPGEDYGLGVFKTPDAVPMPIQIASRNHDLGDRKPLSGSIGTPADASGAFAVGAVDYRNYENGPIQSFSSRGPTTDGRIKPELVAPDAVTTFVYDKPFKGTSASCPHVAGAAAVLMSLDPYFRDVYDLRQSLLNFTVDMGAPGPDNIFGHGRLDLSILANLAVPNIRASTPALDFGDTRTQTTLSFGVENVGNAVLKVSSITSSNGDFSFSPSRFQVTPSAIQIINATFTPTSDGDVTAKATINSNADRDPVLSIDLTGTGKTKEPEVPQMVLFAGERNLGRVEVGDSKGLVIWVTNNGTGVLETQGSVLSDVFRIEPAGLSIPPNSTKQYSVTFFPGSEKNYSATLAIGSNDPRFASVNIPLKGSGITIKKTFALSMDLNDANGDQGKITADLSDQELSTQFFVEGLESATGLTLNFSFDDALSFKEFDIGGALPKAASLHRISSSNKLELTVASLGGRAAKESYLGTAVFTIVDNVNSAELIVSRVSIIRNAIFERYSMDNRVTWKKQSGKRADFDGNGSVGFEDFLIFAVAFGTNNLQCDLDDDGSVGFSDFLIFASEFGK